MNLGGERGELALHCPVRPYGVRIRENCMPRGGRDRPASTENYAPWSESESVAQAACRLMTYTRSATRWSDTGGAKHTWPGILPWESHHMPKFPTKQYRPVLRRSTLHPRAHFLRFLAIEVLTLSPGRLRNAVANALMIQTSITCSPGHPPVAAQ